MVYPIVDNLLFALVQNSFLDFLKIQISRTKSFNNDSAL